MTQRRRKRTRLRRLERSVGRELGAGVAATALLVAEPLAKEQDVVVGLHVALVAAPGRRVAPAVAPSE